MEKKKTLQDLNIVIKSIVQKIAKSNLDYEVITDIQNTLIEMKHHINNLERDNKDLESQVKKFKELSSELFNIR